MKVIFLDFDGVLNSVASFKYEHRRKNNRIADTLSVIACSNLQCILENNSDVKIVISSTWRKLHTLVELQNILNAYGVEAARVIGKTPSLMSGHRGHEIQLWLDDNTQVKQYAVIDDDSDIRSLKGDERALIVQTTADDGLLLAHANKISKFFRGEL